jgi:hypothetical protein
MTAVEYLKQQYIERGETLPSGVFQEALEMEQEQEQLLDQMATQIQEINDKTKLIETKLDELIVALHEYDGDDWEDEAE